MKEFSIILMQFGFMGIMGATIPVLAYDQLSFIVNDVLRFFISIFVTTILIGLAMYILTRFKKQG